MRWVKQTCLETDYLAGSSLRKIELTRWISFSVFSPKRSERQTLQSAPSSEITQIFCKTKLTQKLMMELNFGLTWEKLINIWQLSQNQTKVLILGYNLTKFWRLLQQNWSCSVLTKFEWFQMKLHGKYSLEKLKFSFFVSPNICREFSLCQFLCLLFDFLPYFNIWQLHENWQKMNACKTWELSPYRYWFYLFTFFYFALSMCWRVSFYFILSLFAVLNTTFNYFRDKHFSCFFPFKFTFLLNKCYHVFFPSSSSQFSSTIGLYLVLLPCWIFLKGV